MTGNPVPTSPTQEVVAARGDPPHWVVRNLYVRESIYLVNNAALFAPDSDLRAWLLNLRPLLPEFAARLRKTLVEYVADPDAFRRSRLWRARIEAALQEVQVTTASLSLAPDGTLEYQHRHAIPNDDAVLGFLMGQLCDPRFPSDELRICKLERCGNFFFRDGTKRRYCCQEHGDEGDRIDALDRARAQRHRAKEKAVRKHK